MIQLNNQLSQTTHIIEKYLNSLWSVHNLMPSLCLLNMKDQWYHVRSNLIQNHRQAEKTINQCHQFLNQNYPYIVRLIYQIDHHAVTKYALCKSKDKAEQLVTQLKQISGTDLIYHLTLSAPSTWQQICNIANHENYDPNIELKPQTVTNQNLNQHIISKITILNHEADQVTNGSLLINHERFYHQNLNGFYFKK